MGLQTKDVLAAVRERMKEQSSLFFRISNLDEQQLSVQQILSTAAEILPGGWPNLDCISASVTFNNHTYTSKDYKESPILLEAEAEVREGRPLNVKVSVGDEYSFSEEEQQLIDSIATNLSAKLDRVIARQELKENQELLDKAYKLARIGTWEYDMINDDLYWSDVTKEVHGFGPDYKPDVESTVQLFKKGYHRETFAKAANDAIEKEKPFDVELKIISGKGDERWIRATGEPEYNDEGVCIRFYGISQNVTDRRKAEEELELNDRRFKALVQHGMDMIAILDEEANYRFVSPTSKKVLGHSPGFYLGKNAFSFIHEEDTKRIEKQFSSIPPRETVQLKPFRYKNAEGDWRWLESSITNLKDDPAVNGYVANSRDVTERQIRQEEIIDSLKEKEVLLSEIHHRVKNNLSVLTVLLELQASNESNEEVIDRLVDSVARIQTMASIHEQLYQSNNFATIELADRVQLLALDIQKSFKTQADVDLNFQLESLEMPISRVLPCSLIVNEVLTNIFKHAFVGREEGKITIQLSSAGASDYMSLRIVDNGIGLPDDFNPPESNTLGLKLIDMLSEQLPAKYYFDSTKEGTVFSLLFKRE